MSATKQLPRIEFFPEHGGIATGGIDIICWAPDTYRLHYMLYGRVEHSDYDTMAQAQDAMERSRSWPKN